MTAVADPGAVRDAAREILSRPEFGDHRSLIQRAIDWIGGRLSDLFGRLAGGIGSGAGLLGAVIRVSVVVGAVIVIVLVLRVILRALGSRRPRTPDEGLAVVFGEPVDPAGLARQADEAEARLLWKQAALARYRQLVSSLVVAGVLADVPGRTTGEYRAEYLEVRPETSPDFDAATEMFERAYYGDADVGARGYSEMSRLTSLMLVAGGSVTSRGGAS